jgi:hypothetical protein
LIANILLIYIDHRLGRPSDFGVGLNQWPQISWVVQQPQVFARPFRYSGSSATWWPP